MELIPLQIVPDVIGFDTIIRQVSGARVGRAPGTDELLRVRREWPSGHRAGQPCDELPPPHP
jgi:hypothetical protein